MPRHATRTSFKKGQISLAKGLKRPDLALRNKGIEQRRAVSQALKGRGHTPEHNLHFSESRKRSYAEGKVKITEQHKQALREGHREWFKQNREIVTERFRRSAVARREILADRLRQWNEAHRGLLAERMRLLNKDPEVQLKRLKALRGAHSTPEYRQKMGLLLKNRLRKGPNNIETQLIELINTHNLPFKYTGDGSLIINGYCPDFVNTDGKKQLIEVFGDYFHTREGIPWHYTELGRIMAYNSLGFKCLVIWEHELENNEELVMEKIKRFAKRSKQ